jgi:hypothetical protein
VSDQAFSSAGVICCRFKVEVDSQFDCSLAFSVRQISINYLGISIAQHFEQPASVAQGVNRIPLICRFDGILKPEGDSWIRQDLFEIHNP